MATQFLGEVISVGKMNKTVKVLVKRLQLHPLLKKYWSYKTVFLSHDEKNECHEGDLVIIQSCPKLSRRKSFNVVEIVEKSPVYLFEQSRAEKSNKAQESVTNSEDK